MSEQWHIFNYGGFNIIEKGDVVLRPHDNLKGVVDALNELEGLLEASTKEVARFEADPAAAREQVRVLAEAWRTVTERDDQGGLYHNGYWLPLRQQLAVLGVLRALAAVEEETR